jgi:hypothetical protein
MKSSEKKQFVWALVFIAVVWAAIGIDNARGAEARQLTDKEVDTYIREGRLGGLKYSDTLVTRDNTDPDELPAYKLNLLVPMSTETNIQEGVWQAMNVLDMLQTIEIAKNLQCYEEVGTLSLIYGNKISKSDAIVGSVGFGILHYLVTRSIESLVDRNPDYRVLQRTWQYTGYVWKGHTVYNNHRIGLRPGSSKYQMGSDGVCRR